MPEQIEALEKDPDRLELISKTNTAQALRRFDVLHRWNFICNMAGIPGPAGGEARQAKLDRRIADLGLEDLGLPATH